MNKKIITKIFYSTVFLLSLLINPAYSTPSLVINASESTGDWVRGVITDREVLSTDKPLIKSEFQVFIENPGKYQLFSRIHHNYREAVPCIYAEVSDDNGILYSGSHRLENIWYLDKSYPGRWFMVSLTPEPYWELPRGNLTIRFWADALKSFWADERTAMEGVISIDKFLFIPIRESEEGLKLPWLVYPRAGTGDWDIFDHNPGYATNLAESGKNKETLALKADILRAGNYKLWGSVLSPLDNDLSVIFQAKSDKQEINIKIKGGDRWSFFNSDPVSLSQGEYKIILKHTNANRISIDYLMLLGQ